MMFFKTWFGVPGNFKSNLVDSNPQIRAPTAPENPEIMNIEVFGLSYNQIEKL